MKIHNEDKTKLVNSVFSKVYKKYDLMNDVMSFGVHRIWKNNMVDWMKPQIGCKILDVASGTGDMAKKISEKNNNLNSIYCVEPNDKMLEVGQKKLINYKNILWKRAAAEKLPFPNNTFDFYIISYGIRNVTNINKALAEAFRVLKTGGRFMCLEFSKIDNEIVNSIYKSYSKTIPFIGKYIAGNSDPYEYLVSSIEKFYNQKDMVNLLRNNNFENVKFRNLSYGISAIHSGWKI